MASKLIIPVRYHPSLYTELIFWQYYKGFFTRLMTVGGILSLLLCISYLFGFNPLRFNIFPFMGLLYGLLTLILPLALYLRIKKTFRDTWLFKEEITFSMSENGIHVKAASLEKKIDWAELHSVLLHSKAILFFTTKRSFIYVPKTLLSAENIADMMEWYQRKRTKL